MNEIAHHYYSFHAGQLCLLSYLLVLASLTPKVHSSSLISHQHVLLGSIGEFGLNLFSGSKRNEYKNQSRRGVSNGRWQFLDKSKSSRSRSSSSNNNFSFNNNEDSDIDNEITCHNEICTSGLFRWHASKTKNLYVGGIFPMVGGWPGGQSCLPSAIMALNEVNLNASILASYRVNLNWFNSECNPGKGVSNLYEMIFEKEQKDKVDDIIMLLGPGCSDVSSSVAEVANHWNLTVLSFGSSSPALSDRKRFRTFFRTHPSAILDNPARLRLCNKFNWKKIATLQDNKVICKRCLLGTCLPLPRLSIIIIYQYMLVANKVAMPICLMLMLRSY